jgi:hypothetical protein
LVSIPTILCLPAKKSRFYGCNYLLTGNDIRKTPHVCSVEASQPYGPRGSIPSPTSVGGGGGVQRVTEAVISYECALIGLDVVIVY